MIKNLKNETELSGLYFVYNGSTNLETKGTLGATHILEHLVCKVFDDMQDELQSNGIAWNAYTSYNRVVFYFTGLEEYLAPFRDVLIERMYKPFEEYITPEDVLKENKIVLEEYTDSFTDLNSTFNQNYLRKTYGYYSPIGLREDIENFNFDILKEFYYKQYNKPDMIINVSKTFVLENDKLEFEDRKHLLRDDWKEDLNAQLENTNEYPDTLSITFQQKIDNEDVGVVKFICNMLSNGLNSPLYQELREKNAMCYNTGAYTYKIGNMTLLDIYVLTSPSKEDDVCNLLSKLLRQKSVHINCERLENIRKSLIIVKKKNLINRYDKINDILDEDIASMNNILETIDLNTIYDVYDKYFSYDNFKKSTDKNY